jgi:phosphoglycolate phosphatase
VQAGYQLAIFDLDGTLADSFAWVVRHVNGVADRYRFRRVTAHDVEALRRFGTREVMAQLQVARWKVPLISRHVRRLKSKHTHDIALFPGVSAMLRGLRDAGVRLALVSSDSEDNVRRLLGNENVALFCHFDCGASLFGKAAKFRRVMRLAGAEAAHTIAIGDELRDMEAARAAGIAFGAVTWGYAAPEALRAGTPDLVFERVEDIASRLVAPRRA